MKLIRGETEGVVGENCMLQISGQSQGHCGIAILHAISHNMLKPTKVNNP